MALAVREAAREIESSCHRNRRSLLLSDENRCCGQPGPASGYRSGANCTRRPLNFDDWFYAVTNAPAWCAAAQAAPVYRSPPLTWPTSSCNNGRTLTTYSRHAKTLRWRWSIWFNNWACREDRVSVGPVGAANSSGSRAGGADAKTAPQAEGRSPTEGAPSW